MSERYRQIIKDDKEYIRFDCPVALTAYAVLRDTREDRMLVQMKFRNCSDKAVAGLDGALQKGAAVFT